MTKLVVTVAACATLLWVGTALATQPPQQKCDQARVTAWKTYVACVDAVLATSYGCEPDSSCKASFDEFSGFEKCRHTYFSKWKTLQTKTYAGSTCAFGLTSRFTDNGTTVTDNLSRLVWEKKTTDSSVHDVGNTYTWSTGSPWAENGAAFASFLTDPTTGLNVTGFAGANGWRLPTLAELQTIVLDFPCTKTSCTCGLNPCIDGTFGPTAVSSFYWSATSDVSSPNDAWGVYSDSGIVYNYGGYPKTSSCSVRAVRGGL